MRKYEILSSKTLINMVVQYRDKNTSEIKEESVGVDLANDCVFFYNKKNDVDYDDLEQEILVSVRPPINEHPDFALQMLNKIQDIKAKKYGIEEL